MSFQFNNLTKIYMLPYIILLCIVIALSFHYNKLTSVGNQQGGALSAPFSIINPGIGNGVNVKCSVNGKQNLPEDKRPVINDIDNDPPMTYYGYGIPVSYENRLPGPFWNQIDTVHHTNVKYAPECCPSPYSSDKGCACANLSNFKKLISN